MNKDDKAPKPIFITEGEFKRDPVRYIEQANSTQRVAVFDASDKVVLSMGGKYSIPE